MKFDAVSKLALQIHEQIQIKNWMELQTVISLFFHFHLFRV